MSEPRSVWLVTENGAPCFLSWGLYKNPSSEADPSRKSWAAALTEAQEADPNFDATQTAWRRAPDLVHPGVCTHANAAASLAGRIVRVGGVTFDLDESGPAGPTGHEPGCVCGTLVSQPELQALVYGLGVAVTYVDSVTQLPVTTEPTPA